MTNPHPHIPLPNPKTRHPICMPDGTPIPGTVFLNAAIDHPNVEIGDYTYASDRAAPENWLTHLAPYIFAFNPDRLILGKFCAIAEGVRFITAGANHQMSGPSTYPFQVMDMTQHVPKASDTRDTVIGHDVWLGYGAMVMAGSTIGNGAVIGAGAVVRGHVPDYAIVIGNPAQVVRLRYTPDEIDQLNTLAWWDWEPERIMSAQSALYSGSVADLATLAP